MTGTERGHLDDVLAKGGLILRPDTLSSTGHSESLSQPFEYQGAQYWPPANSHWKTHSTKPELHLEICNMCHPFFTGRQKLIDTEGRVERFTKRFGAQTTEIRKAQVTKNKAAKATKSRKSAKSASA